tara:strand:+ start:377 stop:532 length:156 start_codon:yes stop_codon:yes gene_type:complete
MNKDECNHGCGHYDRVLKEYIGTPVFRNGKCKECFQAHQTAMDNVMRTGEF